MPISTSSATLTRSGVDHPVDIDPASATYAQTNAEDLTPVSIQPSVPHRATCQPVV